MHITKEEEAGYLKLFGEHVKKVRESKALTPAEVCSRCTLDASQLSKIEHGKANVKILTMMQLAAGLDVPVIELMRFQIKNR